MEQVKTMGAAVSVEEVEDGMMKQLYELNWENQNRVLNNLKQRLRNEREASVNEMREKLEYFCKIFESTENIH